MKKLLIIPMLFICSMVIGQSKKIIGKPIRLQKFEVAQHDFSKSMNWDDAKAACAELGAGWRLPTKDELNLLYQNKDKIGGFKDSDYFSSTDVSEGSVWKQYFGNYGMQGYYLKENSCRVRAVRSL